MIPVLLILIPLITGLISFLFKQGATAKLIAMLSSLLSLGIAITAICCADTQPLSLDAPWLTDLGAGFRLGMDGMSKMLCLLTALAFPLIFAATYQNGYANENKYFALLLLAQAGLMGVFLATDALLFYFFWELALIPVYFLCSIWGGEKRIAVTFKFFIYTFLGSLLMLVGILYLYFQTAHQSFALQSFYAVKLSPDKESILFWLFFIAFAIKMPIFPFHTWQPDAYEQSPNSTTMVMSGIMVKMGLFALIRWLLPIFPHATAQFSQVVMILSIIGMIYASLIAMKQDDIKRLIAYSSIAHIGLMCAGIFAGNTVGMEGALLQMFNHGVNVIGLWILADVVEKQLGTRKLSEMGGLANKAPVLAIFFVVLSFANIALPLTNAFVGEFLLFNGLFMVNGYLAAAAGITVILAAIYTLLMVQKVLYGPSNLLTEKIVDISWNLRWVLVVTVVLILFLGVYPQPLINLTKDTVHAVMAVK